MDSDLKQCFSEEVLEQYPEAILSVRPHVEGSVIACMLADLYLYDESGLSQDSFLSKEGLFYFNIIAKLRAKDIGILDFNSLYKTLNDTEIERIEEYGGYQELSHIVNSVSTENWESYLDELRREIIICKAYDSKILLPSAVMNFNNREIHVLSELRKLGSNDVLEFFETIISDLDKNNLSSGIIDSQKIEFDDEWLAELSEGIEDGFSFEQAFEDSSGLPVQVYGRLSRQVKGLLPRTSTCLGGYSSVGKSTWWIGIIMALISQGHKVLFISNEEDAKRFKLKCLSWVIYNVFQEESVKKAELSRKGDRSDRQLELIKKAQKYWYDNRFNDALQYVQIRDSDIRLVKKLTRQFVRDGFDTILYDTFKVMASDMGKNRTDLALVQDSRTLDELAKSYNIIMLYSIQLAEHTKGKLWLDASCLSNCKQVKEILENLFLIRPVYSDELDPSSPKYIRPFLWVEDPDLGFIQQEINIDPSETWRVLFTEKSRSGANSVDTNAALLFRFLGDYSTFEEYAWCRPRHGVIG